MEFESWQPLTCCNSSARDSISSLFFFDLKKILYFYTKNILYGGIGNGSPLWYFCLENPMDRGAWWAKVHRVTKSRTRMSDYTLTHTLTQRVNRYQVNVCE